MINHTVKDTVLQKLINTGINMEIDINDAKIDFDIEPDSLSLILDQFEKKELIKQSKFIGGIVFISITAEAFDLYNHGGFTAQEELLEKNIQKLLLEIESLKPSYPEKVERISTIISGISTALGLFIR